MTYPRVAGLKTPAAFRARLAALGVDMPFDEQLEPDGPLATPFDAGGFRVGNRFCVLPMEGWDGTLDGRPSDLTIRRWTHFGESGAKLVWGGEAVAVRHDGRANPRQLLISEENLASLAHLREQLVDAHAARFGRTDDLLVGLQLTHSGRYARPNPANAWEPVVAYRHPVLDRRFPPSVRPHVISDEELDRLVDDFVRAAALAARAGFAFVDIKHCHGYLGHELLSAVDRPGRYGGSLENRLRFLRSIVEGIRATCPGLAVGVRVSVFDSVPFRQDPTGVGVPEVPAEGYRHAFAPLDDSGRFTQIDEAVRLLDAMAALGIRLVCTTAGSPYYCPHVQRPALFPPSDGYLPPEDPLVGVARQIDATAELKKRVPDMVLVGSGYTYLQEWVAHVGQGVIRAGLADSIGLGRMMLSYPHLPADVLAGRPLDRKLLCRTFSDCTSGPRNGLVSGCYPLDPFYSSHPDAGALRVAKRRVAETPS